MTKSNVLKNTKTAVEGIVWPSINSGSTIVADLVEQLHITEFLSKEELEKSQYSQLASVAVYAEKYSRYFAQKLKSNDLSAKDISSKEGLRKLPIMTRRELQANSKDLFCSQIPQSHISFGKVKTSGSSGEPVEMFRTAINQYFWLAYGLREHHWHKRDHSGKLAVIRANLPSDDAIERANWGDPISILYKTGSAYAMPINRNISEQALWLKNINPEYLLIYPNNLSALIDELSTQQISLTNLKQIRTMGETLSDSVRQRAEDFLHVSIADSYSSQELGNIAMQCAETGLYHVMAESLIVEVLNDKNEDCKMGETGRVVVTDLHNFATPIFRYDIGDYAEVAGQCSCGRGLPALKHVAGRERNMLVVNGQKRWPLVGFHHYREIAPIMQYQLIQKTHELIEVRFVASEPVTEDQEVRLSQVIRDALGYNFQLNFVYFQNQIPRPASGKFEEFVCEIK